MVAYKSVKDMDVANKVVLLRADLNVPVDDQGNVTEYGRIDGLKPTIDYLVDNKAKVLILSHFGRPKGEVHSTYSMAFLPEILGQRWGHPVGFAGDCTGVAARQMADDIQPGQIALFENVRFDPGEEANDPEFAQALAALGDLFVHDAFSTAHRAHASSEGIAHYLPGCAGFMMAAELDALNTALENPERPVAALVGGAKVSSKLSVLQNLVYKVDHLILGGGMANTFLAAQGERLGNSKVETDMLDEARTIMGKAEAAGCEIVLPLDHRIARTLDNEAEVQIVERGAIPDDMQAFDLGDASIASIKECMAQSSIILWNGPLGVFEVAPFDTATNTVAAYVGELTHNAQLVSIAGGGDTQAALAHAGVSAYFSYISSAGGAFLEWLEGKNLPGIEAISDNQVNAA
jgi:phosphoglycerate kinase